MKRNGFLTRSPMARSFKPMARRAFKRPDPFRLRKRSLKRAGKKAKLREQINSRLRIRFRAMGLYEACEVRFPECWNKDLTWAHGKKDRFLTMHDREFLVVRSCTNCHRKLDEDLDHEGMLKKVQEIISERELKSLAA